ncbi:DUF6998 domain-containing protein [Limimaricola pyoseonensis]|uniref:DUF6998 domain-containing protein n=1 Tax=Limimaricola pyoseonensis TaxID=521013 RepID=UPI001A979519|nr:hypothetical protein [Limimaricola pyoseonensis]
MADLVAARNRLREYFSSSGLDFTLDGNLVGDIGEALAVLLFEIELVEKRGHAGVDGYARDGRSVQVKATGTKRGPAFRDIETKADHLIFFDLNFDECQGEVVFNGPEHYATSYLPQRFSGQRMLTAEKIRIADSMVPDGTRLAIGRLK